MCLGVARRVVSCWARPQPGVTPIGGLALGLADVYDPCRWWRSQNLDIFWGRWAHDTGPSDGGQGGGGAVSVETGTGTEAAKVPWNSSPALPASRRFLGLGAR